MDQDLVDNKDYVDKQIDAKIIEINNNDNIYEIGTVVNVRDFIVEVTGINNVMFYEKINIANKAMGYVNSINENSVTVAVLRIDSPINVGDIVYSTNVLYKGSYSRSSMGRVIDLFGNDKLSGKKYSDLIEVPIERKTIPIMDRGTVNRPLLTGITGIDLIGYSEITFEVSFYSDLNCENGFGNITATGKTLEGGMIANNFLEFGTKIYIEGLGLKTVEDRGSKKYFNAINKIDVFVPRINGESDSEYYKRVNSLGRKNIDGYILFNGE